MNVLFAVSIMTVFICIWKISDHLRHKTALNVEYTSLFTDSVARSHIVSIVLIIEKLTIIIVHMFPN